MKGQAALFLNLILSKKEAKKAQCQQSCHIHCKECRENVAPNLTLNPYLIIQKNVFKQVGRTLNTAPHCKQKHTRLCAPAAPPRTHRTTTGELATFSPGECAHTAVHSLVVTDKRFISVLAFLSAITFHSTVFSWTLIGCKWTPMLGSLGVITKQWYFLFFSFLPQGILVNHCESKNTRDRESLRLFMIKKMSSKS